MEAPEKTEKQRKNPPGDSPADGRERARQQREKVEARMRLIGSKLLVLSGKGGVGKSTVAVKLASALRARGDAVGLLDADMHGPSVPGMLRLEGSSPTAAEGNIQPPVHGSGLKVMSIAFLIQGRDEAVIWRGPLKMNVLRQLLADVEWGELDHLVIDLPPGTGDEPLSVCQLVPDATGAVIVTTPQKVAIANVRRCVSFCRELDLPVLGVVENMSGFLCPHCGKRSDIFSSGGGEEMAAQMGVEFLGQVPFDPRMVEAADAGRSFLEEFSESEVARSCENVVDRLEERIGIERGEDDENRSSGG
jgi:Mrp family chromosome partitioning ATPase